MTRALLDLSAATEVAHRQAVRIGDAELAEELRIMGLAVAALIAKTVRRAVMECAS
jgi:hypothetical protein